MTRMLSALAGLLLSVSCAVAQDWPTKPVRFIVPFGPGSTPDVIARLIADNLQQRLGQSFVVENKPGASGMIGTDAVAKAAPDGSTIGISIVGQLALGKLLFSKMSYDPEKDVVPITVLTSQPSVLVVHASLGVNSVAELIEKLKREPGKFNYGSIGNASLSHLAMEAIAFTSGTKMVHIAYGGSPQTMTAVLRNDVQMACLPAISVIPHLATGQIKILAVSTAKRAGKLPDVPTLRESGIDVEADAWNGLIAPAGTPDAIIAKIHREVAATLHLPAVKEKFEVQMMEPIGNSPEAFRAQIRSELERWTPIIRAANIKVN